MAKFYNITDPYIELDNGGIIDYFKHEPSLRSWVGSMATTLAIEANRDALSSNVVTPDDNVLGAYRGYSFVANRTVLGSVEIISEFGELDNIRRDTLKRLAAEYLDGAVYKKTTPNVQEYGYQDYLTDINPDSWWLPNTWRRKGAKK